MFSSVSMQKSASQETTTENKQFSTLKIMHILCILDQNKLLRLRLWKGYATFIPLKLQYLQMEWTLNFMWSSMQRWQCSIYNGTLCLNKCKSNIHVFVSFWFYRLILFACCLQKWILHFLRKRSNGYRCKSEFYLCIFFLNSIFILFMEFIWKPDDECY